MRTHVKRAIPDSFAVLSAPRPPDEDCFRSDTLLMLCNSSETPWTDPAPHMHEESDEVYLVLEGTIHLDVDGVMEEVNAGEICFVPAGIYHAVIRVDVPYRGFILRSPPLDDKVYASTPTPI